MLANFFEKTKPINSLLVGLLFCAGFFLYAFRIHSLEISPKIFFIWGGYFFSSFFFLLLSGFVSFQKKAVEQSLFIPLFVVLLFGMFPQVYQPNGILFLVFVLMLCYRKMTSLDQKGGELSKLFDSGLLMGVALVFCNWTLLYLVVLYSAIFLFGKVSFRNLLAPLFGLLLPSFFFFSYCFLFDQLEYFFAQFLFEFSVDFDFYSSQKLWTPLKICLFLSLFSVIFNFRKIIVISDKFRLNYVLVLVAFVMGLGIIALTPHKNGTEFLFVLLPTSILIAQLVESISKIWLRDLCVLGLMLYSVTLFFRDWSQ
jgi:hypothetical protein